MNRSACEHENKDLCTLHDRPCFIGDKLARYACGIALARDPGRIRANRQANKRRANRALLGRGQVPRKGAPMPQIHKAMDTNSPSE